MTDNTRARQSNNKALALGYVGMDIAIFPSSGKTPLVPMFNKLDTTISPEDRDAAIAKYKETHDESPIHVGSTKDPEVIKRMWRKFRDAVPSIATGVNGLVVIDADQKDDGPAKMKALWEANGGLPDGALSSPTKSGGAHFIFADPDNKFTNAAGLLKQQYGSDVRGKGGQIVAPGAMLDDGRTYGTRDDFGRLVRAKRDGTIPEVPEFVTALIGTSPEGAVPLNDSDPTVKSLLEQLGANEWPDFAIAFDPAIGWSLESLREHAPDFGDLYDSPGADRSTNRFKAARYLVGAYPDMTVQEYATFCREWDGAGDAYDDRQLAREFAKAKAAPAYVSFCTGEAFGPVVDNDDRPTKGTLPFELESDVAANATLPDWLIEEVIESETLCVLYGPPNAGKSLALLDALYHVAAGKPWRGRDVKQGCVLYVSVEGPNGTARRAKAWRAYHGVADDEKLPLAFIRVDVDLFNDKKAAQAIVEAVGLLEAMTNLPCRAVAIDTVNAVTPGMDENSSADVGVFLRNLRTILAKTRAAVLPVHHTGKDESRGMRGSNALLAKAETTLLVAEGLITTMKMRDGQRGQRFPFEIKIVNLWENDKGKPVGAPVAVERQRGEALVGVDETDDDATLIPPDTPADKLTATLRVFKERVEGIAANTGEAVSEIGLSAKAVFDALNVHRRASGLPELKDRTIVSRLLGRLAEGGEIVKSGDNRRTEYSLR